MDSIRAVQRPDDDKTTVTVNFNGTTYVRPIPDGERFVRVVATVVDGQVVGVRCEAAYPSEVITAMGDALDETDGELDGGEYWDDDYSTGDLTDDDRLETQVFAAIEAGDILAAQRIILDHLLAKYGSSQHDDSGTGGTSEEGPAARTDAGK